MEAMNRKYPVGIQTFERVREEGYLYIDKTDLVWEMTKESPFVFLSRPRRFGKSLLTTTLSSYFKGQKELFEGLKIMALEKEWESYPVIHLDLSVTKAETSVEGFRNVLFRLLEYYKNIYGEGAYEDTPGGRLSGIIHRAYEKTGKQVVVIIDEYDAPLLDKLHENGVLNDFSDNFSGLIVLHGVDFFQRRRSANQHVARHRKFRRSCGILFCKIYSRYNSR